MSMTIDQIKKSINTRIGKFLRQERKLAGKTFIDVSKQFSIDELLIARWEAGLASPQGFQYVSILKYYGLGALERAERLDWQLQMERHQKRQSGSFRPNSESIKVNSANPNF